MPGSGQNPHHPAASPGGKILKLGGAFVRTLHHFFPELNAWLDEVPDTRFHPFVQYHRRFLLWLALLVFTLRLGSRRQIDFVQLWEKGSLLCALALAYAQTGAARLWGGQDKLAQRLLEALRSFLLPVATTEPACCIRFLADTA